MSAADNSPAIPLREFDIEMATTRKMLERLPDGHDQFKPHEKSMAFGYLGQLVAGIPSWIAMTLRQDTIDLASQPRHSERSAKDILSYFDDNVASARDALQNITGARLLEVWSLKMGERVLMTAPRGEAARQHLNHLIHHRGQLSVYERLLDVKLPQIYGPSADTPWG